MTQLEYIAILFNDTGFTAAQRKGFLRVRFDKDFPDDLTTEQRALVINELKTFKSHQEGKPEPEKSNQGKCRSCGAAIQWGELKGRPHPYNPDGTSHFSDCPQAKDWRRR